MRHDVDRDPVYKTVKEVVIVKSSKLIIGCVAALGLGAGVAMAEQDANEAAIAKRLAPVGELCLQGEDCGSASAPAVASSSSGGSADGEAIYNSVCMACHDTGAAGAPIHGDEAAWADRVTKGFDTLLDHSTNGFNAMPARGGNPNITDEEMLAVTKYMLEPVMDVPADEAPAEDTADDAAADETTSSDDAASTEDEASAEEEQTAADDSSDASAAQDEAADSAQDDATEAAATDSKQEEATEVAGADLPGASKITVCVACHGKDGHGTSPTYPNLAGQNATYLESSMKAYRAGEREGGMSAVMTPMAANLSDEDIVDIAEYYSQQPR